MHRTIVVSVVALVLSAATVACTASKSGPSPTTAPTLALPAAPATAAPAAPSPGDASYPAPNAEARATLPSYPSPEEGVSSPVVASLKGTPVAGKGHVQGVLVNRGPGGPAEPLRNRIVYLAQMLSSTDGALSGIVRVDENSAPVGVTDGAGHFVFENVEPGWYALAIKIPRELLLARDVNSGDDVLFQVQAGQIVDTGEIVVSIGE